MKKVFLFPVLFIILGTFACAQNAGNTGTFTGAQLVFNAQSTSTSSAIFSNIGQSAHFLTYCDTSFGGTIDMEASFSGTANWVPIARASYSSSSTDSGCHVLQAGGYYQYVRSSIVVTAGSLSAWYSSTSGPIGYAPPAIGTNGPTSPIACDLALNVVLPNGTTNVLAAPVNSGDAIVICSFSLSFGGATSAGSLNLFWASSSGCSSTTNTWVQVTTASTPQTLVFPGFLERSPNGPSSAYQYPCVTNGSGANAQFSFTYASIRQ